MINIPSFLSKIFLTFLNSSDKLSICANTFVPVITLALPYFFFIKSQISLSKKLFNVFMPLLFAIYLLLWITSFVDSGYL